MNIEGILEAEPLRDFLYSQMRGARGLADVETTVTSSDPVVGAQASADDEALALLREIRDAMATLAGREAPP
jgi:putative membrane protein